MHYTHSCPFLQSRTSFNSSRISLTPDFVYIFFQVRFYMFFLPGGGEEPQEVEEVRVDGRVRRKGGWYAGGAAVFFSTLFFSSYWWSS